MASPCSRPLPVFLKKPAEKRTDPHLVLASGGKAKVPIILAAVRRGLAHTLMVDEEAGRELLKTEDQASAGGPAGSLSS